MYGIGTSSSTTCCGCGTTFSDDCSSGFHCKTCGSVLCGRCVQGHLDFPAIGGGAGAEDGQCIKSCDFCSTDTDTTGGDHLLRFGEKLYLSPSPHETSHEPPPSLCYPDRLAQPDSLADFLGAEVSAYSPNAVMTSSSFGPSTDPSPLSRRCCPNRSDGDDIGDYRKHLLGPSSEYCRDTSDLDTNSSSARHEFYSSRSVGSTPPGSPSRITFTSHRAGHSVQKEKRESPSNQDDGQFKKTRAILSRPDSEISNSDNADNYCSDNLSIFMNGLDLHMPLDFANNGLLWCPPPPNDENDEAEGTFFCYDDEDDDMGESGVIFSSTGSFSSMFPAGEKHNEVNRGALKAVLQGHFRALVLQLLHGEGVNIDRERRVEEWLEIVTTLAWQAANFVKPYTSRGGSMDPGDYVKVRCIASASPSESALVKGVVCTKNIKHKRMTSNYKKPRLILLGGALEYQRIPNQLASIDTLLQQEIDHLKMVISKIEASRPNVLLVEKSVSSYAQEYLLAKEISLVLNVKRPLLERIARCTGALIAPSSDEISTARLGNCELFRVEKISEELETSNQLNKKPSKTLMFFEGCPKRLGCTVLLKGSCREELKKVKHVVQYAVFAAYQLLLETSFLADEGASLPETKSKSSITMPEGITTDDASSITPNFSITTSDEAVAEFPNQREGLKDANQVLGGWESLPEHFTSSCTSSFPILTLFRVGDALSAEPSDGLGSKPELPETMAEGKRRVQESNVLSKPERVDENEVSDKYFLATDSHESILVTYSSHCLNGSVCERSRLLRIKFYGCFDKPLGRYLCDDLFGQTCRYCNEVVEAHVRCYAHQQGILTINVRRLPSYLPGERDGKIWMWHRCLRCAPRDGVPPATSRVVMSDAAWALSFGKFLELSFSNHATANRVARCGHSLQRDCLRYYGFGSMVAFLRYSPIDILSVYLPPSVLDFNGYAQLEGIKNEAEELMVKTATLYEEVSDALNCIEQKHEKSDDSDSHDQVMELRDLLRRERNVYDALLQSVGVETLRADQVSVDFLELNRLRRSLLIGSHVWDHRLYLFDSLLGTKGISKVMEKDAYQAEPQELRGDFDFKGDSLNCGNEESLSLSLKSHESPRNDVQKPSEEPNLLLLDAHAFDDCKLITGRDKLEEIHSDADHFVKLPSAGSSTFPASCLSDKIDSVWTGTAQFPERGILSGSESSDTQIGHTNSPPFRGLMSPVRFYSFDSAMRIKERNRKGLGPSSMHLSNLRSFHASGDYKCMIRDPISNMLGASSPKPLQEAPKLSFTLNSTPTYISCVSHIAEGGRVLLPTGHNNLVIAVYDDEPSSIISYALSSKEYGNRVGDWTDDHYKSSSSCDDTKEDSAASASAPWQSFGYMDLDYNHYGSYRTEDKDITSSSVGNLSATFKPSPHLTISFGDDSSIAGGKVKFSVTFYFAKEFDALRKKCCRNFVRSFCRCRKWMAEGGKSNVYFARSLDERFIIKQVTKTELDSFEELAFGYFRYLTDSLSSRSPICLAKVLGIYQVTVKHLKGGKETKMDLMVMENLFFRRSISRVYDLKGSERARYNPDKTGTGKVLLDMNLLETLCTKPIFLGIKAKRILERAVWNDTFFLASVGIMDYSLLVGVDEKRKELVIGIIDYMRQYTWDKHLETWVKASGILGGPRNASPTIISPDQYKRRFRKAMTSYFITIPDQLSS